MSALSVAEQVVLFQRCAPVSKTEIRIPGGLVLTNAAFDVAYGDFGRRYMRLSGKTTKYPHIALREIWFKEHLIDFEEAAPYWPDGRK